MKPGSEELYSREGKAGLAHHTEGMFGSSNLVPDRQICVSETKNLVALEKPLTSAGTPQRKKKFAAKSDV